MEQENKSTCIMVVKLVKGKVSGMQKFLLKEGNTPEPLLDKKCLTSLKISSVFSCVPNDIHREESNKKVWRRCTCGITFIYRDDPSVSASFRKCRYCCKAFHDIKCLETHLASAHKTIKKCSPILCINNSIITDSSIKVESATLCANRNAKAENDPTLGQYHKCHYCDQYFHHADILQSHLATVHKTIRRCPCNKCCNSFQDVSSKRDSKIMNSLVDNKVPVCHGKLKKGNQQSYIYSRKGPKPYKCAFCPRKFARKALMLEHEAAHTRANDVLCEICGKMIPSLKRLRDHFLNNHRERDLPCDFCGKLFGDLSHLKRHLLVHTQEKPHHCHKCGKDFARDHTLMMHLRVHNNFKPHVCKICKKAFCQPTNLKTHMRVHGIFIRRRVKNEKEVFDELKKAVIPNPLENSG